MRDVKHYSHADQSNNNNKRGGKKKNYNQTKWKTPLKKTKQVYRVPHTNKFVPFFSIFKFSFFSRWGLWDVVANRHRLSFIHFQTGQGSNQLGWQKSSLTSSLTNHRQLVIYSWLLKKKFFFTVSLSRFRQPHHWVAVGSLWWHWHLKRKLAVTKPRQKKTL